MRKRPFGSDGPSVGVIGQGTWQLERDRRRAGEALRRGVELGLQHVDTAEIYGSGAVERLVGEALQGLRDRVFLVSKIHPARATRRDAMRACEASLERLGTDHLDVYLLHWLPPHSLEEAVEAMESLVAAGRIRRWGVSNFDEVRLEQALAIAGPGRIACNQVLHHLEQRAVEHAVIPFCQRHGIAVVGYSPFAVGGFPAPASHGGRALQQIAAAHGASARQVALAFLTRLPGTFTIPKAANPAHLEDNAGAGDLRLDEQEIARIEAAFPLPRHCGGVPMW
ncbi:MAG TPA: aldo/keto reductase [Pseudomonadales bacterium]